MTNIQELMTKLNKSADVFVLICGESVLYDADRATVYVPESSYTNTSMNPLADFKSHIGHNLLWSRHENVACTSGEMLRALEKAGFGGELVRHDHNGSIYRLVRSRAA